MAKRSRPPPLPSCYSTHRPFGVDPGIHKGSDTDGINYGNVKDEKYNRGGHPACNISFVEHHDGRRFWCDRFYLNTAETSSVSPSIERRDYSDCDCDCGSLQAPPTFPLVDFVNQSLHVKAAVMGTFHIHPEWFRKKFPRFGARRSQEKESNDGIGTDDSDNDSDNGRSKSKPNASHTVPTIILHGHRGLEKALVKRVKQADEIDYETDRDESEDEDGSDKDYNSRKHKSPRSIGHNLSDGDKASSKFKFFLPATTRATETARQFVNNPDLRLYQVHCNWEKNTSNATTNTSVRVRVSSDKENGEKEEKSNTKKTRETKFGVHHPKFLLLFEQSGDLVVIVTTSNLTPTNESTVEGSWVQRFRRRNRRDTQHVHGIRKRHQKTTSSIPRHQEHTQENDFGPVLQDFLVRLSEAAEAGAGPIGRGPESSSVPFANNNEKGEHRNHDHDRNNIRSPLEEFLSAHIGLKTLSEFSELYHFETAQAYLVPIIPGDYKYDPDNSHQNSTRSGNNREKSPTRYYYGRQRVRYILDKLATSAPKISKKTQDKSKSDRLLLQPTSLGSNWSRSQFASLVREYMGYYGGSSGSGNTNNKVTAQNDKHSKTFANRKTHKKQKTNHDYPYHRDDFWVCRQADIVWPSDRFMVGVAKSVQSSKSYSANIISPLQAATKRGELSSTTSKVMNSFAFNSSRTFNACDLEFITRMSKYQPSTPCQLQLHRSSNSNTGTRRSRNIQNKNNSNDGNTVENKPMVLKAPHFKSIARLFQNHVAIQKRDVPPADAYFSWFLLTSACLSVGAQGAAMDDVSNLRHHQHQHQEQQGSSGKDNGHSSSPSATATGTTSVSSTVAYRNFELGVLFVSHLPKKHKVSLNTKRLSEMDLKLEQEMHRRSVVYCFHPHHCSCGEKNSNTTGKIREIDTYEFNKTANASSAPPQLVHLPIPYNLRPESYFQECNEEDDDDDDDDDEVMKENPFFHEICNESRCIGNMLLTPFGQRESKHTEP